jgi:hypothetical protein
MKLIAGIIAYFLSLVLGYFAGYFRHARKCGRIVVGRPFILQGIRVASALGVEPSRRVI